ncbi:MAG: hypothetical protein JNK51_03490 [Blastocatellia bacterium]|nr:hypothetical protein [Chloracidobacterium sp.]MBL8183966.1 hypothetical protein [Blastocatellia bacterium]HRJ89031.1 hypothetical protein [Pyrinomonadaceae bacterium]HRK49971.1 hypothetical protein [Pyrinomonadaceae bacterium]
MSRDHQKFFNKRFRDVASVSLIFAALEKRFPLSHRQPDLLAVDNRGKVDTERAFNILREFSTGFPHTVVERERQ